MTIGNTPVSIFNGYAEAAYEIRTGLVAAPSLWHLLTAPSQQVLEMTLERYGQDRAKVYDEAGRFTGQYRQVLKVFLIDREGNVRNIVPARWSPR